MVGHRKNHSFTTISGMSTTTPSGVVSSTPDTSNPPSAPPLLSTQPDDDDFDYDDVPSPSAEEQAALFEALLDPSEPKVTTTSAKATTKPTKTPASNASATSSAPTSKRKRATNDTPDVESRQPLRARDTNQLLALLDIDVAADARAPKKARAPKTTPENFTLATQGNLASASATASAVPKRRGRPPKNPRPVDPNLVQHSTLKRPLPTNPYASTIPCTLLDRFLALARLPGRRKKIPKSLVPTLRTVASRAADAYIKNPCEDTLLAFLELPKRCLFPAARRKKGKDGRQLLERYLKETENKETGVKEKEHIPWPEEIDFQSSAKSRAEEAERLVRSGRLGPGCKHLTSDTTVADIDDDVLNELIAKHPAGPANPCGTRDGPDPGRAPGKEVVLKALDQFDPESSPGISGWTFRLLKTVCEVPRVLEFIVLLTGQVMQGTAPGRDMLCASRLTAIRKPNGGIRPIAVGESLYRLIMSAILEKKFDPASLLPCQLGVKSPGGIDPIARGFELAAEGKLDQPYKFGVSLDGINAFNEIGRDGTSEAIYTYNPKVWRTFKWAYGSYSDLVVGKWVILSRQGVRQGDNLGPYFYSMGSRPTIEALQQYLGPGRKVVCYLDDTYVLSIDDRALDDCFKFFDVGTRSMKLNKEKCKQVSMEEIRTKGFELLGTCVGGVDGRRKFLRRKVEETRLKLARL